MILPNIETNMTQCISPSLVTGAWADVACSKRIMFIAGVLDAWGGEGEIDS
jgi:hypothetical protein